MASKGTKIPSGGKVSSGSKVSVGKSEQGSDSNKSSSISYWELQLKAMNRKQLRKKAKELNLSPSGTPKQLRNRIKEKLENEVQEPKINASKDIDRVSVENIDENSLITVADTQAGKEFVIIDRNTDNVASVNISGDLDDGIITVDSVNPMGKRGETVIQINPETKNYSLRSGPNEIETETQSQTQTQTQTQSQNQTQSQTQTQSQSVNKETEIETVSKNSVKIYNNVIFPTSEYPIPKPIPRYKKNGKGLLKSSQTEIEVWNNRKKLYEKYVKQGRFPVLNYWRSNSKNYVPLEHFENNLQYKKAIAEKPSFFTKDELKSKDYVTTQGNQIQTRIVDGNFLGIFSQKRSGATIDNPTPTIFRTKEIRVDNDDIGNYIAAINNMNNPDVNYNPYAETMYIKESGIWVRTKPDPLKVNRAHVKSMLDSAGYDQGKIIAEVIQQELGSKKVLSYRDVKGDTQDLSMSEQQLAITNKILPKKAEIVANTPAGEIIFEEQLRDFDITDKDVDKITFRVLDKPTDKKKLTSDDLLIASVRKYDMQPHTVQALAESLYQQGFITYPRTDQTKAEVEEVGIELLKPIDEFNGSNEERKILLIIKEGNKAIQEGNNYLMSGLWELQIGKDVIAKSTPMKIFADERKEFSGSEVDLTVRQVGITPDRLTNYLIQSDIGTPATRTQLLEELESAGIVTLQLEGKEKIYRLDQRGIYMASAFDYLKDHPESRITELGRRVKNAKSLDEVISIWKEYKPVNKIELQKFIKIQSQKYLEIERDLALIEAM